jgi:DNA-binding GntR family transcriptional regulator
LRRSFERLRKTAEGGGRGSMLQVKAVFYAALFDGAGNETIKTILLGLQARITVLRSISMSQPGRLAATVEEVRKIVEALEARDPDAAEQACATHVMSAGAVALAALKTSGEPEGESL